MRCDQIWDLLSVYADNETNHDETAMVETHIADCSDCARNLRFLRATSGALNLVPDVNPPMSLRQSILDATVNRPTWGQRILAYVLPAGVSESRRYAAIGAVAGLAGAAALLALRPALPTVENSASYRPLGNGIVAESSRPAVGSVSVVPPSNESKAAKLPIASASIEPSNHSGNASFVTLREQPASSRNAGPRFVASIPSPKAAKGAGVVHVASAIEFKANVSGPAGKLEVQPVEPPAELTAPVAPGIVTTAMMITAMPPANDPMAMVKAESGMGETLRAPSTLPAGHIALASETRTALTEQMVTLADLKHLLRKQATDDNARFIRESIKDKQIRLDVVHGRF